MKLRKIISGGQTGVDRAGLEAGKKLNLETGGTAPKNYRTDNGSDYSLKDFGLIEHSDWQYKPRTIENVKNSDGTVWFGDSSSPGGRLTLNTCKKLNKPYTINPSIQFFIQWLEFNNIEILNVAGNRESTNPGIQEKVEKYIINVVTLMRQK